MGRTNWLAEPSIIHLDTPTCDVTIWGDFENGSQRPINATPGGEREGSRGQNRRVRTGFALGGWLAVWVVPRGVDQVSELLGQWAQTPVHLLHLGHWEEAGEESPRAF